MFDRFSVRFVPHFGKKAKLQNGQKSRKNRTNMDIILSFLAKPVDKRGITHINHYIDNDRVSFSMNDNFSRNGLVEERLYKGGKDTVHLNNEGVRLLSGNLINGLKRQFNVNLNAPFRKYRNRYERRGHYPRRPFWGY